MAQHKQRIGAASLKVSAAPLPVCLAAARPAPARLTRHFDAGPRLPAKKHTDCSRCPVLAGMPLTLSPAITHTRRLRSANSSLGWSAGERDWFEITESFLECKDAVTALDSGFGKRLSSTEVESTLKDWPTDEQASLGRADGSLSNPCRHPTTM